MIAFTWVRRISEGAFTYGASIFKSCLMVILIAEFGFFCWTTWILTNAFKEHGMNGRYELCASGAGTWAYKIDRRTGKVWITSAGNKERQLSYGNE